MTNYVSPYTVTVTSTAQGVAVCSYVDGKGRAVPDDAVLTTGTAPGVPGSLVIRFTEAGNLRLVGATVKTLGEDPALTAANLLIADRSTSARGTVDTLNVGWVADSYTTRGLVLTFAQVDASGMTVCLFPTTDPQVRNEMLQ